MRAFITGITGQDGSYLAEFLISKGYEVHGLVRRCSTTNDSRISHIPGLILHLGDLSDGSQLKDLLKKINPDEVYNLAAQSHVRVSFDTPLYTSDVVGLGALRLLEAVRSMDKPARFYQASSSEMFGAVVESPQTELTPFRPRSPYGCAKVFAHYATVNYREAYNLFSCCGILFNHESPRRGAEFVTRKITLAAGRIAAGIQDKLFLGNIEAKRDWGFSGDYVKAMWLMLQQDKPDDYVIATGETHTVKEFLEEVFAFHELDWKEYVETDTSLFRPSEVELLLGKPDKAYNNLGWYSETSFKELAKLMAGRDCL